MTLSTVSKTLFFTLCSRALDKKFEDPLADEIIKNNPELKNYAPDFLTQKLISNRARFFDQQIKRKKQKYPEEKFALINLGGGLCSRFDRVSTCLTRSIQLDLPEVIDLFEQLFPKKPSQLIRADLTDFSWINEIQNQIDEMEIPIFCMEGVSMYLEKKILLQILTELPKHFPRGVFVCDFLHPIFNGRSFLVRSVSKVGANFSSGIRNASEILNASADLKLEIVKAPFTIPFNLYQFATFSWGL